MKQTEEARNLVALRSYLGVTQKQLAYTIGVTSETIRNWEKTSPKLSLKQSKILEYFGIRTEYIISKGEMLQAGYDADTVRSNILHYQ